MDGETNKPEDAEVTVEAQPEGISRRRRIFRFLGLILIALAILLAVYGTVIEVAWERGQSGRADNARLALEEELASQLTYAQEDVLAGNFNLALRRLEWILERDPDYPGADSLRQDALLGSNAPLTTPFPTTIQLPTPRPPVEELSPDDSEQAQAFATLQQIFDEQDWRASVTAIVAFQAQYPDYNRRQSDALLYDAYLNLGQLLIMGDQVELGLFNLAQAEKLGDLPLEAEDQRLWAELYLLGISYYGVDWGTAVHFFRELCAAAPFYQNACLKLHEALISHGDQYAANQDWCPAEKLYVEAILQNDEPIVSEKLREARKQCLEATPTPSIPITGTESISSILPMVFDES